MCVLRSDGSAGSLPWTQLDGLFVGRFEWKWGAGSLMLLLLQIPQLRRNEEARRPVWGSGLLGGRGGLPFIQRSLHPLNAGDPDQPAR